MNFINYLGDVTTRPLSSTTVPNISYTYLSTIFYSSVNYCLLLHFHVSNFIFFIRQVDACNFIPEDVMTFKFCILDPYATFRTFEVWMSSEKSHHAEQLLLRSDFFYLLWLWWSIIIVFVVSMESYSTVGSVKIRYISFYIQREPGNLGLRHSVPIKRTFRVPLSAEYLIID